MTVACEACGMGGYLEVYAGHLMHPTCAPGYLVKDAADLDEYTAKVNAWWETPAAAKFKERP